MANMVSEDFLDALSAKELNCVEQDKPVEFAWEFLRRNHLPMGKYQVDRLRQLHAELRRRFGYAAGSEEASR